LRGSEGELHGIGQAANEAPLLPARHALSVPAAPASDSFNFSAGVTGDEWDGYRKLYAAGGTAHLETADARAEITAVRLDRMILFDRHVRGLRHERTPEQAAVSAFNHFTLHLNLHGVVDVDAGDGLIGLAEGEAVLLDASLPMQIRMVDVHLLTASLARDLIEPAARDIAHGHRIRPERTAALRSLLAKSDDGAEGMTRAGPRLLLAMLEMLASDGRRTPGENRLRRTVIRRALIRDHIAANLTTGNLEPSAIARACGLSRTTLYRLTEADGGVASFVRMVRLAQLERLLATDTDEPLADLANHLGFADASHMSRQFRAVTGLSPGRYRAASRDDAAAAAAKRQWAAWMADFR
jgi:AraC-like DNA-binding protein